MVWIWIQVFQIYFPKRRRLSDIASTLVLTWEWPVYWTVTWGASGRNKEDLLRGTSKNPRRTSVVLTTSLEVGMWIDLQHLCQLVLPTWHKLESSGRRELQLRRFFHQTGLEACLFGIFLSVNWCVRRCVQCHLWAGGHGREKNAANGSGSTPAGSISPCFLPQLLPESCNGHHLMVHCDQDIYKSSKPKLILVKVFITGSDRKLGGSWMVLGMITFPNVHES